jgi:hypothetical protein
VITNAPQLGAVNRIGSVMIGVDPGDATHEMKLGKVRCLSQHEVGLSKLRQRRANALQARSLDRPFALAVVGEKNPRLNWIEHLIAVIPTRSRSNRSQHWRANHKMD